MLSRSGLPEVPCPKCGERVRGLPWGELCPACSAELGRRAAAIGRRIALAAAVIAGVYVGFRMPADPTARYYGLLAVVVTYILVRRIAQLVLREVLK